MDPLERYTAPFTIFLGESNVMILGPHRVSRENRQVVSARNDEVESTLLDHRSTTAATEISAEFGIHKEHMNYSGASTCLFFKVSEPIELTKLFFYGQWCVHLGEVVDYFIEVDIFQGLWPDDTAIPVHRERVLYSAIIGEYMIIGFKNKLYCKPKTWYTVQFILNGPDTLRMHREPKTEVAINIQGIGTVNFDFMGRSRQLPEMEFRVLSPLDLAQAEHQWKLLNVKSMRQRRFGPVEACLDTLASSLF